MPMVTRSPPAATSTASRTASPNGPSSGMTWSAANDPTTASGSSCSTRATARPMAAIESRGEGSAMTRSGGRSGSWERTASACAAPVTTSTRPSASGLTRRTVACSRLDPVPVRSWRNFGDAARLSGQSRVPAPPAGMTAQNPATADMLARVPPCARRPRGPSVPVADRDGVRRGMPAVPLLTQRGGPLPAGHGIPGEREGPDHPPHLVGALLVEVDGGHLELAPEVGAARRTRHRARHPRDGGRP